MLISPKPLGGEQRRMSVATRVRKRKFPSVFTGFSWIQLRSHAHGLTWVVAGKGAFLGANAVLLLFLAQRLTVDSYGQMVVFIGAQVLISRVLLLGVDNGMIRLRTLPDLHARDQEVIGAGLLVLMCTCGMLLLGTFVAGSFVNGSANSWWSPWTAIGVTVGSIGTALVDYGYAYHLTRWSYRTAALVQGGTAMVRLVATSVAVFLTSVFGGHFVLLVYAGVSFLSGLLQAGILTKRSHAWPAAEVVRRLLRYSLWQAGASVTAVLSLYEGTFLLIFVNQRSETGIFGVGLTFSLGFFGIYVAFYEYFFPRMVRTASLGLLPQVLVRTMGGAVLVILGCVALIFAIGKLAPYLIKPALWGGVPVFYCLAASMLLLILQSPFEAACQYLLRPGLVVFVWVVRVLCTALLGLALAPTRGAMGLALAQTGASAIGLIVIVSSTLIALRSANHRVPRAETACVS
jgi:O-antigen/teichoic acid export membrane protein